MTKTFRAPWARELIVMSAIGTLVLGMPIVVQGARGFWLIPIVMTVVLAAVVLHCVRGYEIADGELRIRRLLWHTPWPLDPGTKAIVRPNAMRGSWRVWGNGGLYAITGRFSGSGLGRYHAFVTDPSRTVVITTERGIVVVSPDRPDEFATAIAQVRYSHSA